MIPKRVIPVLLLRDESLVKTRRFSEFDYVGDPCNTVRIFNELEVDEILFLDISIKRKKKGPNFSLLEDIAGECFMPLGYGGGITTVDQAKRVFDAGFEKIVVNSGMHDNPDLIGELASRFGSQSIIASIDVRRSNSGEYIVWTDSGRTRRSVTPVKCAIHAAESGVGEILITSIDREGSWDGFDLELVSSVTKSVNVPVIAHGGAGKPEDVTSVIESADASAAGVGSLVVYQKQGKGVLVNFPAELHQEW